MIVILLAYLFVFGSICFGFRGECFGLLKKVGGLRFLLRSRYLVNYEEGGGSGYWRFYKLRSACLFLQQEKRDYKNLTFFIYDYKTKEKTYDGVNWKTDQGSRSNANNSTCDPLAIAGLRDCTCSRCNSIRARQGTGASVRTLYATCHSCNNLVTPPVKGFCDECITRRSTEPLEQLQGAVRAWRLWVLRDTDLVALTQSDHVWQPGDNVDPNYRQGLGELNNVGGGFYGFSDYDEIQRQEPGAFRQWYQGRPDTSYDHTYVIGSILCTARMKVGTKGIRAEKARPEYLVLTQSDDMNLRLMSVSEKYGMRLITENQARELRTGIVPYKESGVQQ